MTLAARLAHTDVEVAKVFGNLPWARIYDNGHDATESLTYLQLIERVTQPARYSVRAGRSRRH
jgi:hypothetical protein